MVEDLGNRRGDFNPENEDLVDIDGRERSIYITPEKVSPTTQPLLGHTYWRTEEKKKILPHQYKLLMQIVIIKWIYFKLIIKRAVFNYDIWFDSRNPIFKVVI